MYCDQPPNSPSRRRVGDAVDAAGRASRRRAMHRAGAAPAAGAVHVEEHRAIAFAQRRAVERLDRPANRFEHAGRDVTRNNRIRHAGEPAVPEMHVGAADFRSRGAQQRCAGRQDRDERTRESRSADAAPPSRRPGWGRHLGYIVDSLVGITHLAFSRDADFADSSARDADFADCSGLRERISQIVLAYGMRISRDCSSLRDADFADCSSLLYADFADCERHPRPRTTD